MPLPATRPGARRGRVAGRGGRVVRRSLSGAVRAERQLSMSGTEGTSISVRA